MAIAGAEPAFAIGQAAAALATGRAEAEQIAPEIEISRAVVGETGMPSEGVPGVPGDTTDQVRAPAAVAVPQVWDLEGAASAEVAGGAGRGAKFERNHRVQK